ncbi:MAG: M56 family metallopeptidase [Verrucomicrobiae bacterium]|nr:M56 family metallopeptidase [Verrucomicrobiae bacterium]
MTLFWMENFNSFFGWLIHTSFRASVLTGLVLLLHLIFRRQLSARWRYILWFTVLLCLVMPVAPSSRLSVFNLLKWPVPAVSTENAPATSWRIIHGGSGSAAKMFVKCRPLDGQMLAGMIWLAGVLALMAQFIIPVIRLRMRVVSLHSVTDSTVLKLLAECKDVLRLTTPLWVVESPAIRSPVLMGFIRPRLLLPVNLTQQYSLQELRFIFLHELAHVRHNDIVANWLMTILQTLHWFNPFIWLAFSRMRADREAACDERALSCSRDGENREYGNTILKLLENSTGIQPPLPVLAGILETKQQLKRRFSMIANYRKTTASWGLIPVALFIVLASVGLTAEQNQTTLAAARPEGATAKAESPSVESNEINEKILVRKLKSIVLPELQFKDTNISDVVSYMHKMSIQIDTNSRAKERGVEFAVGMKRGSKIPKVTMSLKNISLFSALNFLTQATGWKYWITADNVVFISKDIPDRPMGALDYVK